MPRIRPTPEARRAQYHANADKMHEKQRAYKLKNLEKVQEYDRQYRQKNKRKIYEVHRDWVAVNPDKVRVARKKWEATNKDKVYEIKARRRARKRGARITDLSTAQWEEIQAAYQYRCVYCHKRCKGSLTQDHLTPLSLGGQHTASNIVPSCLVCNSKKHDNGPLIPVQPLLLTLAPAKRPHRKRQNVED